MSRKIKEVEVFVKSSSDPNVIYQVTFTYYNDKISVDCSCTAGLNDRNCKHKTALILNDPSMCVDDSDIKRLNRIHEQPEIKLLTNHYHKFLADLEEIEKEQKLIRNKVDRIKRSYAISLRDGVIF